MHPLLSRNFFYFRGENALAEGDPGALIRFALPVAGAVPTVYRFAPQETTLVQLMAQTEDGEPILRFSGGSLDLSVYDEWDNPVGLVRRPLMVAATATLLRRLSPKPVLSAAECPAF